MMFDDTQLLDWMIFSGACVCHDKDGGFCWVEYSDKDGWYKTDNYDNARDAIANAKMGNVNEL